MPSLTTKALEVLLIIAIAGCSATTHEKPKRSGKAKYQFRKHNPCPATGHITGACNGWVIDHVKALDCGGADSPENMQWQTTEDAKAKDRTERDWCW